MSELRTIADITIGPRHRSDMGDIAALADSIREVGLLHQIGVTRDNELVFGERRLRAAQLLGWTEIMASVIDIGSIAIGEYHENAMRKDFTVSERVAILETIERYKHGGDRKSLIVNQAEVLPLDREQAVKRAGLGNTTTAREATTIVKQGIPALVEAVDRGEINIEPGFAIARQPAERQAEILRMPISERRAAVRELARPGKNNGPKPNRKKSAVAPRAIDIPYKAMKWPTKEELEYPPEGSSLAIYDAYFAKYGRTPLHPKTVKELMDCDGATNALAVAISSSANAAHPDAEQFFDYIDQMLGHVPQTDKDNGMERNFAGKARTTLALLERALPKALALLLALDDKMRERKAGKPGQTVSANVRPQQF